MLLILFFLLTSIQISAQNNTIENLLLELNQSSEDTNKVNLLNELSYESYRQGDFEAEMTYGKEALKLAQKLKWKKGIADSYRNIGGAFEDIGDYNQARLHYNKALNIYNKINDKAGVSMIYNNIGEVYRYLGNYPEALKNYFNALKIKEEINDQSGLSMVYNNMGIVHQKIGNYQEALKNHQASLEIEKDLGDQLLIASSYNNIGLVHEMLGDYDEALKYQLKALELREEVSNKFGMSHSYGNIGILYYIKKDYEQSLKYCLSSLALSESLGDKTGIISAYNNLARIYISTGKAKEGKKYLLKALALTKEIGHLEFTRDSYLGLYKADSAIGDYGSAIFNYKKYIAVRDSLKNEENTKISVQLEMQYEFDKKEAIAKAEQDKKDAIAAEQIKKKEIQQNILIGGVFILLIVSILVFRSYQNKRKANKIISKQKDEVEKQKHIVEEKNMEIIDSIAYAKSLQDAILPPIASFEKYLNDVFVLYLPKDIVAGDFYWFETVEEADGSSTILFAAADCTGHGVPGAMVSVVCSNALHRAHVEFGFNNPGEILDKARDLVIQTFEKSQREIQDGMDISLVALQKKNVANSEGVLSYSHSLEWAGANNPIWILRNNEIIEYKANKQPVGKYANATPFTTHNILLNSGDLIYIFTDGFQDQFGGVKGKKFKAAELKKLLISIAHLPMSQQKEQLLQVFEDWKGNLEQVDDVCIIGVRL